METILNCVPLGTSDVTLLSSIKPIDPSLSYDLTGLKEYKKYKEIICYYLIRFATAGVSSLPGKASKPLRASAIYNLGTCYLEAFKHLELPEYRDCSLKALNKSIRLESNNAEFWVALGNASLTKNLRVAQHCFIRASSLAPKDGEIWINLAVLYLNCGDLDLASKCFARGQSIAPTSATAWAGQALLADASGNSAQADHLYIHSYVISKGTEPLTMIMYGLSVLRKLLSNKFDEGDLEVGQQLNVAVFAMINYLKYNPIDQLALTITLLLIERIHSFDKGIELSFQLCELLELKFEETDDHSILNQFALAKSQLARLCLGNEDFDAAIESAEASVEVLGETGDLSDAVQRCILSSLAVTGLAYYFKNQFEDSLVEFKKILEISPDAKRVIVLISQILYAYDEAETKQAAIEELFQNITDYVFALGACFSRF
ncbi:unnamed protein product [Ambrosiozyma monospora]|uniref:Unnamed protein product n=1 Tax=Ambrosiozyma monospora TaxID=43982 RepID=A0ACB5TEB7_AMBMO|nr:unnamed protein product [Ambrosiozyma monospora]